MAKVVLIIILLFGVIVAVAVQEKAPPITAFEEERAFLQSLGYTTTDNVEFTDKPIVDIGYTSIADNNIKGIYISDGDKIILRNDTEYIQTKSFMAHELFHSAASRLGCFNGTPLDEGLAYAYEYYRYPFEHLIITHNDYQEIVKQIPIWRVNCLDTFFHNYSKICHDEAQVKTELLNDCGVVV